MTFTTWAGSSGTGQYGEGIQNVPYTYVEVSKHNLESSQTLGFYHSFLPFYKVLFKNKLEFYLLTFCFVWISETIGVVWFSVRFFCFIFLYNYKCCLFTRRIFHVQTLFRHPDPGGEKWPQKIEKRTEFSSFEVLDVHFWGLMASPVAWASFM
jgi:hypothetical protein